MTQSRRLLGLAFGFLLAFNVQGEESFEFIQPEHGYFGTVSESETNITIDPPIKTQGKLVCKFSIIHHHDTPKPPFEISMENQEQGLAVVKATHLLNCEEQNEFKMHVEAIACDGTYAERAILRVVVNDINEFAPEFAEDSVSASVKEGVINDNIIQVKATDKDCSKQLSQICEYKIETENQPFQISSEGIISNTVPLNFTNAHNFVLSVVAKDCGDKKSSPILVIIEVKQPCRSGWTGLPSELSYTPGTGPQPLYSHSNLAFCNEDGEKSEFCPIESVEATLALETRHVGKGCDRDTYSISNQRILCGANEEGIKLLDNIPRSMQDTSSESDQSITRFDGNTGIEVTDKLTEAGSLKLDKFSISTWMKHEDNLAMEKHRKEHIFCIADDHKKNRHHSALFIRNCKLVLLLRREYVNGEENIFRPAEWRWNLPQVCDNEWHHYAINVNFPHVYLVVDGDLWTPEKDNPEIIDDWPLHPVGDQMTTKMSVGACWQGSENRFRHEIKGYLAGLVLLPGINENLEVLKCLHQCSESLQVPASSSIAPGMEMVSNKLGTRVTVDGSDPKDISSLVNQIAYLNTREFPSPGKRILTLSTRLNCKDGSSMALMDHKATIDVMPVPEPKIDIVGTSEIARDYDDFKLGVRIFTDVHIVMTSGSNRNGEPVNGIENRLDRCEVTVSPPLNGDHEFFEVPDDLLKSLKIQGSVSASGAIFRGAEMIYNYERLLRQVTYTNKKPAYYLNRQFKIICSEMNNRFMSNEYEQTLTVIHPTTIVNKETEESMNDQNKNHQQIYDIPHAHRGLDEQTIDEVGFKETQNSFHTGQAGAHSNVVALIAVVCVAFLAVLLILGIIRVRAGHQRSTNEDLQAEVEMAWDDSPLNITINPMQALSDGNKMSTSAPTLHENPCSDEILGDSLVDGMDSDDDDVDDDDSFGEDEEDDDLGSDDIHSRPVVMSKTGRGKQRLEWDDQDL